MKSTTVSFGGLDWAIKKDDGLAALEVLEAKQGWIKASVPGNIQSDLESQLLLKPLWYGEGDEKLIDVCQSGWWYKKAIEATKSSGKRQTLVFEGVDYSCDIYINDMLVLKHEGMFVKFFVEITDYLKEGENTLLVYIHPMPKELLQWIVNSDGKMSGDGSDFFFVEANNQIRRKLKGLKSPANCSYDWGTNIYTLGIWKDVLLISSEAVYATFQQLKAKLTDDYERGEIVNILELNSAADTVVIIETTVTAPDGKSVQNVITETILVGINTVTQSISINSPELWWPHGYGEQPLYQVESKVFIEESLSCSINDYCGFRDIQWELTEGAPKDFPNKFALVLNGVKIRTMGSNIVSPDLLPGRIREDANHFIEMAKECGMNTLRQHGGQAIYPQFMYKAADELGVMLLVDFPIANCVPENEPIFLDNFAKTVSNIVKQLRNHPSIIEWSGGNELEWYFDQTADHAALEVQEKAVYSEDDTRVFRATCPIYGSRHAPWVFNPDIHYKEFNLDIKDNFGVYPMMRYGEFGCQSPANLEVWLRDIPPSSRWPVSLEDPVLIRKNAVNAVFTEQEWLCLPIIEYLFGEQDGIENTVKAGQFIGAEGIRYMMDALRAMGEKLGGFTSWDYNEPWPNGAGSYLVDYDGVPLMAYYFAKQAMAPLSLQLKYDNLKFSFFDSTKIVLRLVSDLTEKKTGLRWSVILRDRYGEVYNSCQGRADIEPIQTVYLADINITPSELMKTGPVFCELKLCGNEGELISERIHIFAPEGVAAPLRGLLYETLDRKFGVPYATTGMVPGMVKPTQIKAGALQFSQDKDRWYGEVELENTGSMTALFVRAMPMLEYRGDVIFDDNYIFIPAGEKRSLKLKMNKRDGLSLSQLGLIIEGWNTDTVRVEPDESVLLYMGTKNRTNREYGENIAADSYVAEGNRINTASINYIVNKKVSIEFTSSHQGKALLCLNISDCKLGGGSVVVNENVIELDNSYGLQDGDRHHLAKAQSKVVEIDVGTGHNKIEISTNNTWFTWDSLVLLAKEG